MELNVIIYHVPSHHPQRLTFYKLSTPCTDLNLGNTDIFFPWGTYDSANRQLGVRTTIPNILCSNFLLTCQQLLRHPNSILTVDSITVPC
ncbi:hypothetical protein NPIL_624721 [Nephila pilipes]|uniref:Uncharacterized protein n=1 Tax=Nephila pilipes TaxID=299642 RepID=A0A8X6QNA0_NEPPI|nr:hypothetical protein NPIL_624721 [Nephila pilipes]